MSDDAPYASRQLVGALVADEQAGNLRYSGLTSGGRRYAVEVNGRRRVYPLDQMAAWHRGFTAGRHHDAETLRQVPPGAGVAPLVDLLTAPSLADQCRVAILAAM